VSGHGGHDDLQAFAQFLGKSREGPMPPPWRHPRVTFPTRPITNSKYLTLGKAARRAPWKLPDVEKLS